MFSLSAGHATTKEPDMIATTENVEVGTVLVYTFLNTKAETKVDRLTVTAVPNKKAKSYRATREIDGAELFVYVRELKKFTI
jgi:hypothetical protein